MQLNYIYLHLIDSNNIKDGDNKVSNLVHYSSRCKCTLIPVFPLGEMSLKNIGANRRQSTEQKQTITEFKGMTRTITTTKTTATESGQSGSGNNRCEIQRELTYKERNVERVPHDTQQKIQNVKK